MLKKKLAKSAKFGQQYAELTPEAVIQKMGSRRTGLNLLEIGRLRKQYGYNEIVIGERLNAFRKFLKRFQSPLIIVLLIIGTVSYCLGDIRSGTIVYLMILLSAVTDFVQEHKSARLVEKLKEKVITMVETVRDGKRVQVKARELVPGDIICLSVGSVIAADARLIQSDDFFVNESLLTGEAFPVEKSEVAKATGNQLNNQTNLVFSGANVVSGYGRAVVISTGVNTVYGRLAEKLAEPEVETEFERGIKGFGSLIVKIISVLVVLIFVINSGLAHKDFFSSLMFSLALAVGLTPELLPMIMSVTLARGSQNMANKGVIVKRLNSIHDFGGMDILCTDKTGTLTENRIELVKAIDLKERDSAKLLNYTYLNSYFQSGIANPLDEAILRIKNSDKKDSAGKAQARGWRKLDETPFDFVRRRLSVALEDESGCYLISKGAPESVFDVCGSYEDENGVSDFDAACRAKAIELYHRLSSEGYRVLALGYRQVAAKSEYPPADERDLVLLGLVAFLDPPKLSARKALDILEAQGVEIKVITGDNELVTGKICRELNLLVKGVLTGQEIDKMSDKALRTAALKTTIFARVSPEQKARVVAAVKREGRAVGYLGDGINDALPLKTADVGISVNNAVDVAKEAADLILLTKDLKVLAEGVYEGRRTFGNTTKYILMGLSSNFGNMFSVAAASFALPFLPMIPIQILLNNFLYDFSQVTIPTDNVDKEYLLKPKQWDLKFIKKFMYTFGPISSVFDIATFAMLFLIFKANEQMFQTAWFMESLATQTLVIFIIRTRKLPFLESRPGKWLVASVLLFLGLGLALPFSPLASYFSFARPSWSLAIALALIVGAYLTVTEIAKQKIYKKYFN